MDYKARFYDGSIGRFVQPDTIGMGNRYAYVGNNPIISTDPSGKVQCKKSLGVGVHSEEDCDDGALSNFGEASAGERTRNSSILIGGFNPQPINNTTQLSTRAEESSCNGCSVEPEVEGNSPGGYGYNVVSILPDIANFAQMMYSMNGPKSISIYVNFTVDEANNISINSLTIINPTNQRISLLGVTFTLFFYNDCENLCYYPASTEIVRSYSISQTSIAPTIGTYGIAPAVERNSYSTIPLIPSGEPKNQTNTFPSYINPVIWVNIANTDTNQHWAPITYPIRP
jgi:hypothetical protein